MPAIKEFLLLDTAPASAGFAAAWETAAPMLAAAMPQHHGFRRHVVMPLGPPPPGATFDAVAEFWRSKPDASMRAWPAPLIDGVSLSSSVQFLAEEHIIKEGRGPVKFMSLLRRKPGIDAAAFSRAWRVTHPLVVRSVPEIWNSFLGYRQNHVIEGQCRHLDGSPMAIPFDGIVEIWFASETDLMATMTSPRYREIIRPDEETFVNLPNIRMLATEDIVVGE